MIKHFAGIALLLAAQAAAGAVQYEFHQVNRSDNEGSATTEFSGRAVIDGSRSRVDFVGGNAYLPGSYVISPNGRSLIFVDPTRKVYAEVNTSGVAAAVGASNINIEKLVPNVVKLEDHPLIAGVPTDHYRMTLNYDITLAMGQMKLTQSVRTTIDKWTTVVFGDISENFLAGGAIRTGNPKLDEVIELETTKIKGFALRQTVQITTTDHRGQVAGSKLEFSPTRTQSREMVITSIREMQANGADFVVPASYHQAESPEANQPPVQTLSLEPPGKSK